MNSDKTPSQPLSDKGLVETLNKMGFMMEMDDPYRRAFIEWSLKKKEWVLEIGAAYGIVTLEVIKKGGKVIANDLDPQHLHILGSKVPKHLKNNLQTLPGKFPNDIEVPKASLEAVLSSQVFHFLNGEDIKKGFQKVFQWLKSKGKFFVVTSTPYVKTSGEFIKVYEERKSKGELWPGYTESLDSFSNSRYIDYLPELRIIF